MDYKVINETQITSNYLDYFIRYQETEYVYYLTDDNTLKIKKSPYIDSWDDTHKGNVIKILRYYLDQGGSVVSAYEGNKLVGFAALNGVKYGSRCQYLNLGFIHVSKQARRNGIGKLLFEEIVKQAKLRGATKLYIGANPSVDTYKFYESLGCEIAKETIQEIYEHEPLDLQLEFQIN